jgi:putative exosortase-associated protein (TIGR04073 family)
MRQSNLPTTWIAAIALACLSADASAYTAAQKFGRGLAGMTCGVMELPGNIVQETRDKGPAGIPLGFALGLGMIVTRELAGVYEFITAPFPLPEGFRPILSPEYPWDYFGR